MKVLFLNEADYANVSFTWAKALRSVGVDAESLTLSSHEFGYSEQSTLADMGYMAHKAQLADVIFIGHSHPMFLPMCQNKRTMVIHTGTRYRQNPEQHNAIFNERVERTFTDSAEFMSLGGKNITYLATAVDTDKIQFAPTHNKDLVFAHYPSNEDVKGTRKIIEMMNDFDVDFRVDTRKVSHEENLKRMAQCDVYIEMFSPLQDGKPYGSAGVTAWEAAAMGKIVITNFAHPKTYMWAHGLLPPFLIANNEEDFRAQMWHILGTVKEIENGNFPNFVRNQIVEFHSMQATGNYLKKILLENY